MTIDTDTDFNYDEDMDMMIDDYDYDDPMDETEYDEFQSHRRIIGALADDAGFDWDNRGYE